jgi:hypothetical protein
MMKQTTKMMAKSRQVSSLIKRRMRIRKSISEGCKDVNDIFTRCLIGPRSRSSSSPELTALRRTVD